MTKMRRFTVYPIKKDDISSVGIVEFNTEKEIVGRYGLFVGQVSQTELFRTYSKWIIDRLVDDEQAVVHSFHQVLWKKGFEFPQLHYFVRDEVKKYSYCWEIARLAQITQASMYETIKQMEEL